MGRALPRRELRAVVGAALAWLGDEHQIVTEGHEELRKALMSSGPDTRPDEGAGPSSCSHTPSSSGHRDGLVSHHRPVVAAIAAMGLRVSEWFEPGGPRTVDEVADTYSEFALKLLS